MLHTNLRLSTGAGIYHNDLIHYTLNIVTPALLCYIESVYAVDTFLWDLSGKMGKNQSFVQLATAEIGTYTKGGYSWNGVYRVVG